MLFSVVMGDVGLYAGLVRLCDLSLVYDAGVPAVNLVNSCTRASSPDIYLNNAARAALLRASSNVFSCIKCTAVSGLNVMSVATTGISTR